MSEDRTLYDAAISLMKYVHTGHSLIRRLTIEGLEEISVIKSDELKRQIEKDSLHCLADISHAFPIFAEHSDLVTIPVEPIELVDPDMTSGTVDPDDLRGTSYHHAAVNFLRFHCIGTNFWRADSKGLLRELPPKFDIDTLLYGLEMERMRVFKSIVMEQKPGERIGIMRSVKESPKPKSALTIRNDYQLIEYNGNTYHLNEFRAKCFKVMYENQRAGRPPMRDTDIIFEADEEKDTKRLRDVFKNQPIYGEVIINVPGKKGFRKLVDF